MAIQDQRVRGGTVQKPRDDEIDAFGLTHVGKVRTENQDHFLIASLHRQLRVHQSSMPGVEHATTATDRLAFLAMVADGVGGGQAGEEASRFVLEAITSYVNNSTRTYYTADPTDDASFRETLEDAAMRVHEALTRRAEELPGRRGMATTLTLFLGVWPRIYLLQVGDSRYYFLRNGALTQLSRDQTMAQALIDLGVLTRTDHKLDRLSHVLSSAIGGAQTTPVVTGVPNDWGMVHLLCSDGLTRHVNDERIAERLRAMTSARAVCEQLLEDALDGGGRDNITIIVARPIKRDEAPPAGG
ncbi:MAG: serine/threonine-protein phosphatase [Gemmatimonadaceae bacterium]|nr:serine/threonine-protein phosphatase [Gemmatimonadaceae bacterium]